jgi:hypothetical protein
LRQIEIFFNPAVKRVVAGEQGEHAAALLVCHLPEEFAEITRGDVDFLLNGKEKHKRHFSENQTGDIFIDANTRTLYITLTGRYTACRSLRVQVGGRANDGGEKLIWTPMSETITFNPSIGAGFGCAGEHGCGPAALIRDLVRDAHSHTNLEVLNQITDLPGCSAGGVFLRELQPGIDYTLSYGLAQLPIRNVNRRVELLAYQPISLAAGESQSYQVDVSLQTATGLLPSDFDHLNPAAISVTSSNIDSDLTIVESSIIAGGAEDGLQITASLHVKTYNGQQARLELAANIDLENGCTLSVTATPLDGDYQDYLAVLAFGADAYTEPREVYAVTLDFAQPVGPLDGFEAVSVINAPGFGFFTQVNAKRYLPLATTLEVDSFYAAKAVPVVWEGNRLHFVVDDGAEINGATYDTLFAHLHITALIKTEGGIL